MQSPMIVKSHYAYIFVFLSLCLSLSGCGDTGGDPPMPLALVGEIQPPTYLRGDHNNVRYPIMVYLPEGYEIDADMDYPLLLILDAEWNFKPIVDVVAKSNKKVIVVGVGNSNGITGTYQRGIDYTWPGGQYYYNFLILQVIPYIESMYSIDSDNRTLSGHSFGGLFTVLAMLMESPNQRYFNQFFSQDGSLWKEPEIIRRLESQLYDLDPSLDIQLILSGALGEDGNAVYVDRLYNMLLKRGYSELDITYLQNSVSHSGDTIVSMVQALDILYPD